MGRRYSIAEARNRLPALVHRAEDVEPVELTRRGKPVAVIISLEDFQRIPPPKRRSFEEAVAHWRATVDPEILEQLDPDEIYAGVRDRSPGRDFSFDEE